MMNIYQQVEEYYAPLEVFKKSGEDNEVLREKLMLDSELGFLCGLIKQYRPKKMVEVGVAAGGSTAVILSCINQLGLNTEVFSVDLAEAIGAHGKVAVGYLIDEVENYGIDRSHHHLLLGKTVAAHMEDIGDEIDFLILDAAHSLPGELMDFLAVFPYLKKDAVVVMHDVAVHFVNKQRFDYATSILFHSVTADKFLNNAVEYPDIAAFRLNEDTEKYIMDVCAGLLMPWGYMPAKENLAEYEAVFSKHYSKEFLRLYTQAKNCNREKVLPFVKKSFCVDIKDMVLKNRKIFIYGTRSLGRRCLNYLREQKIGVEGFVVSDGRKKVDSIDGTPVFELSQIAKQENVLVLLANNHKETEENIKQIGCDWMKPEKRFIKEFGDFIVCWDDEWSDYTKTEETM